MNFRKVPRNHGRTISDNEVIGYVQEYGIAIIQGDFGDLFYVEIPQEHAPIGNVIEPDDLIPIQDLPDDKRQLVNSYLQKGNFNEDEEQYE